jgi:hypothetical protein
MDEVDRRKRSRLYIVPVGLEKGKILRGMQLTIALCNHSFLSFLQLRVITPLTTKFARVIDNLTPCGNCLLRLSKLTSLHERGNGVEIVSIAYRRYYHHGTLQHVTSFAMETSFPERRRTTTTMLEEDDHKVCLHVLTGE